MACTLWEQVLFSNLKKVANTANKESALLVTEEKTEAKNRQRGKGVWEWEGRAGRREKEKVID